MISKTVTSGGFFLCSLCDGFCLLLFSFRNYSCPRFMTTLQNGLCHSFFIQKVLQPLCNLKSWSFPCSWWTCWTVSAQRELQILNSLFATQGARVRTAGALILGAFMVNSLTPMSFSSSMPSKTQNNWNIEVEERSN